MCIYLKLTINTNYQYNKYFKITVPNGKDPHLLKFRAAIHGEEKVGYQAKKVEFFNRKKKGSWVLMTLKGMIKNFQVGKFGI